jgi:hypothetical protein
MRIRLFILALTATLSTATLATAQFKEGDPGGAKLGQASTQKWRCGMVITATGGPCRSLVGYAAVPVQWPEQEVKIVEEDVSPGAKVNYQTVDGTIKIMTVRIANLSANQEAKALVTFEVRRSIQMAPENTDVFRLPEKNKLDRSVLTYLATSPKIECTNPKIRELAKKIGADKEKAWQRVEAIYDFVRSKVEYKHLPHKGAVGALKEGAGDCEDMTSLFIAICRAANIPARTVWIPGHVYPEFYLLDDKGEGHWFPCQVAGTRAFGEMPETKPILAKGDNFRPPYNPKEHERYIREYLTGAPMQNGGKPTVKFVRELVN